MPDNSRHKPDLAGDQLWQSAFDAIGEGVSILDKDLNIIKVNRAMERWYDSAGDAIGKKCYEAYLNRTSPCSPCSSLEAIRRKEVCTMIVPRATSQGEQIWLESYSYPLLTGSGEVSHVIKLARDISSRKATEEALRKSEENLAVTLSSIGDGVISTDLSACVTGMNPAAERLTGWPLAKAIGKPLSQVFCIVNTKTGEPAVDPVKSVLEEGKVVGLANHTTLIARNQRQYQIADSAAPIRDFAGNVTGVVLVFSDATAEYNAREALKESEENYRLLVENIPGAVFLCLNDQNWTTLYYSEQIEMITGYPKDSFMQYRLRLMDICHPDDKERVYAETKRALDQCKAFHLIYRIVHADGAVRWIEEYGDAVKKDGQTAYLEGILFDITGRMQTEEALRKQLKFEQVLSEISSALVKAPLNNLNLALDRALRLCAELFGADRSYIFTFSPCGRFIDNDYEWCGAGVEPHLMRLKNYPTDALPWIIRQIRSLPYLCLPDAELLPPEAAAEKAELQLEKIKSLLIMPLQQEERLIGFIGLDYVYRKMNWTEEQNVQLKLIADNISSALTKQQAEEALFTSEEKYRDILSSIEEGYYEADLKGHIVFCNEAAAQMLGYTREELLGLNYRQIYKDYHKAFKAYHRVFISGKPDRGFTMEMIQKDGSSGFGEVSISLIKDREGKITGFRGLARDITKRVQFEERLRFLSLHDQLTGIYNRTYFEEELQRLSGGRDYPVSIISVDIDDLKLTNDTQGHHEGDKLLVATAAILKESLRSSDILSRVGGDEFAVILPRTDMETAESVTARIRDNAERYNHKHKNLRLGISLGIATAQTAHTPFKDVYKQADDMMYRDKLSRSTKARNKTVQALLSTLAERDFITEGHVQRLEHYCRKMGGRVGLSSGQMSDLALLAQVHDLGKIGIKDSILFKKGRLTDKEWEIMRRHPEKGYRIALSSVDLACVADLILKHHERWDGSGYPLGIAQKEIPVECRILAVVDSYDAMTHDRPYSKAKSKEEALAELAAGSGSQFDPDLVKIFTLILEEEAVEEQSG